MILYILHFILLFILFISNSTEAIKCFCKNADCDDSITCNGDYCIVGLGGQPGHSTLDQKCINRDDDRPEGCSQNWNGFTEVCVCKEDFCNTFAFFRASIDSRQQEEIEQLQSSGGKRTFSNYKSTGNNQYHKKKYPTQSNSLILLLVIVPLAVGGSTICLIFLNYHCKMR
uniref:Activin types I and II receptor domain-containing protein n=1 Tax=Strongyloides venezuelensis TaxID=75913 RepID=A0A0K0EXV1_STRVS